MASLKWSEQEECEVLDVAELRAMLADLGERFPGDKAILVDLVTPAGDSLVIGVGREVSVLSFSKANGDSPCLSSVSSTEQADECIVFHYMGEWTPIPKRNTVPAAEAISAAEHFLETGDLPQNVYWEED